MNRLLGPRNGPGRNPGVGNLSLLQGIFPIQGSNPGVPHGGQILYHLSHQGSPRNHQKSMFWGNPTSNMEGAWLRPDYLKMGAQDTESRVSEAGETESGIAFRNTRGPRTGACAGIPLRNSCGENVQQRLTLLQAWAGSGCAGGAAPRRPQTHG